MILGRILMSVQKVCLRESSNGLQVVYSGGLWHLGDVDHFPLLIQWKSSASRRWQTKSSWFREVVMIVGIARKRSLKKAIVCSEGPGAPSWLALENSSSNMSFLTSSNWGRSRLCFARKWGQASAWVPPFLPSSYTSAALFFCNSFRIWDGLSRVFKLVNVSRFLLPFSLS